MSSTHTTVSNGTGLHLLFGFEITDSTAAVGFSLHISSKDSHGVFLNKRSRSHVYSIVKSSLVCATEIYNHYIYH